MNTLKNNAHMPWENEIDKVGKICQFYKMQSISSSSSAVKDNIDDSCNALL